MWDKIKSDETLVLKPWEGQQFVGVSGSPLAIRGCSHVKLRLAQQESFQHQVLAVDSLVSEGILGLDFLQEHNCTIDLSRQILEVSNGRWKIPLESTRKVSHPVAVELIQAVNVPARSEMEILGRTQAHVKEGGTWLMEEKSNCKLKVLVARAVVSPHKDTVVVHLLNPHSESVTLHEKTKIAEMTELDAVSIVSTQPPGKVGTSSLSDGKRQMLQEMVIAVSLI